MKTTLALLAQMPSIGHIAVGLAAGRGYAGPGRRPAGAMIAFSLISAWPDVDVIGFRLGVRYEAPFGHRGATHSLAAALALALVALALSRSLKLPPIKTAAFTAAVAASHGLLDTLNFGGGLGCALLWPLSAARFWAPLRFLPIAPLGMSLFTRYGLKVVCVEAIAFTPFWLYAAWPRVLRPVPASERAPKEGP